MQLTVLLPTSTPGDAHYEFFELVLQWPPAFGTNLGSMVGHWTIHGLWPSRIQNSETYPCTCSDQRFREDELVSIMPLMREYWPSFKSTDYSSFWAHEWEKHGTCCIPLLKTQLQYFNTTLNLRLRTDPGPWLGDFQPSAQNSYPYDEVYKRLSRNGDVALHCSHHGDGKQALTEVILCMTATKDPIQFTCPKKVQENTSPRCNPNSPIFILPVAQPNLGPRSAERVRDSAIY
jgi:ribonuclease I